MHNDALKSIIRQLCLLVQHLPCASLSDIGVPAMSETIRFSNAEPAEGPRCLPGSVKPSYSPRGICLSYPRLIPRHGPQGDGRLQRLVLLH